MDATILLPEVWVLIRAAGLDRADRYRLARCASWLRTLDPGPYLDETWDRIQASVKEDPRLAPVFADWVRYSPVAPTAMACYPALVRVWIRLKDHTRPTLPVYCSIISGLDGTEWCIRCGMPSTHSQTCRAHALRIDCYPGGGGACIASIVTCATCNRACFEPNRRRILAGKNLQLLLKNIWRDNAQGWIDQVLEDATTRDYLFSDYKGRQYIEHPSGARCCKGWKCYTCPACDKTCSHGCNT